jgi:hypothetical protein
LRLVPLADRVIGRNGARTVRKTSFRKPDSSKPAADIDRKTSHFALLVPRIGNDADVGGFLDMNKFVTDGCVERLPSPAVHAQPKPPVANFQPIGRCELIALVPAGVFFELIGGGSTSSTSWTSILALLSGRSHSSVRDQGDPARGREKTSCQETGSWRH